MRESTVESYFVRRVKEAGGDPRKMKGRINEPDRIVLWGGEPHGVVEFVELKRPKAKPRRGQAREHKRLRDLGFKVFVIDTKAGVDDYVGPWA